MTAQIRPNRMEVSDRFPMLGFAVRTDEPNVDAEVVLATDIGLFGSQNRNQRTAANFYSSREHGTLTVPRGEGVFVVPPDVLARFIGSEKIYFGLATGRSANGGLTVDALPRDGSPYVSLRGFTGRTLRRSFGGLSSTSTPRLEWTGDAAKPGSESANGRAGNTATQTTTASSPAPSNAAYDDGFGPMPAIPARESMFAAHAQEAQQSVDAAGAFVPPQLPTDPRRRANRIGGGFGQRIGEALDLGLDANVRMPLLNTLDPAPASQPMSYARSMRNDDDCRRPPAPGARAMDGGASVAIAVASLVISQLTSSQGDVTWTLDQLRNIKHPNNVAPSPLPPMRDAPTIRLDDWPVSGSAVDDISAWFAIDWQCNGQSLGNVRISNIGVNDAVAWGLDVRAEIMDDSIVYSGNRAALRIRFSYRFTRTIGSDVLAYREVHLFGDGTYNLAGDWIQSSVLAVPEEPRRPSTPGARAMDGVEPNATAPAGVAMAADRRDLQLKAPPPFRARSLDAAAIAGIAVDVIQNSSGDIKTNLANWVGVKHPNDIAPDPQAAFQPGEILLRDWPIVGGTFGVDDIYCWLKIRWQYNGTSLGRIYIDDDGHDDAAGWGLTVNTSIEDDSRLYVRSSQGRLPGAAQVPALHINITYIFDEVIADDQVANTRVSLFADGTYEVISHWVQHSRPGGGNPTHVVRPFEHA